MTTTTMMGARGDSALCLVGQLGDEDGVVDHR